MGKYFYLLVLLTTAVSCFAQTDQDYLKNGTDKANKKDFKGAISDLDKAIELNPKQALAYCVRGEDKFMLHDYTGAIVDFDMALELDPKIEYAYCGRGLAEVRLNQTDKGCLDLKKAKEMGNEMAGKYSATLCK